MRLASRRVHGGGCSRVCPGQACADANTADEIMRRSPDASMMAANSSPECVYVQPLGTMSAAVGTHDRAACLHACSITRNVVRIRGDSKLYRNEFTSQVAMDPLGRLFAFPPLKISPGPTSELSALAGQVQSAWFDVLGGMEGEERTKGYRSDVLVGKEALLAQTLDELRVVIVANSRRADLRPAERQWVVDLLPELDEVVTEFERLSLRPAGAMSV